MPQYVFERVDDPTVRQDFFYTMKDVPSVGVVVTIEGIKWKRIFTKPRMAVDTKCDPFSAKDFVKATNKQAIVGDMWDRAKEMSLKRVEKTGGVDPVKETFYKNYSRRRKGNKHPEQKREEAVRAAKKKGINVDWGDDD